MMTITPGKAKNIDFYSSKNDRKRVLERENFLYLTDFARELNIRMNKIQKEKGNNEEGKVKIDNKLQKKSVNNSADNKDKLIKNGRENIDARSKIENKGTRIVKSETKKLQTKEHKTIKEQAKKELRQIKDYLLQLKKNNVGNKHIAKSLNTNEIRHKNSKEKYEEIEKLKKSAKNSFINKANLVKAGKGLSIKKSSVKISHIKSALASKGLKEEENRNGSLSEPIAGSNDNGKRKVHFSAKKIKLRFNNEKKIQKNNVTKISIKNSDSKGQDDILAKHLKVSSNSGVSFKTDALMISKKYDFNIPGLATKTDNLIHRYADEVFDEIVKHFSFVVNRGGGEAKLSLYPPELGKVKMNIKLNNGKVSTFFLVENQTVKELIDAKLNILQQQLMDQGFALGSFNVGVKDESSNMDSLKNFSKDLNGLSHGAIDPINEVADESEENVIKAALPWLSSYVNITV